MKQKTWRQIKNEKTRNVANEGCTAFTLALLGVTLIGLIVHVW